jgi:hypothetical protein
MKPYTILSDLELNGGQPDKRHECHPLRTLKNAVTDKALNVNGRMRRWVN